MHYFPLSKKWNTINKWKYTVFLVRWESWGDPISLHRMARSRDARTNELTRLSPPCDELNRWKRSAHCGSLQVNIKLMFKYYCIEKIPIISDLRADLHFPQCLHAPCNVITSRGFSNRKIQLSSLKNILSKSQF